MRTGLVMEGGAMRGLFTAGVTDVLMEYGITFDGAIGVSAGATFGCNYKSGQIGRAVRYNCEYCTDSRYGSLKSLITTGNYFNVDFCYHEIPDKLDPWDAQAFRENPMEFWAVAANLETGKAVYQKCMNGDEKDIEWIRASASVPLVSKIVEIDGLKLLDGGIADSVPLKFFEEQGYLRNLVILTQPDSYVKKKNKATPLCRLMYKDYPKFVEVFENRHVKYNANIEYVRSKEREGSAFVIRPAAKLELSNAEKDATKLRKAYEDGRIEALRAITAGGLLEWLKAAKEA